MDSTSPSLPSYRTCGTMQVLERLLESDPEMRQRLAQMEEELAQHLSVFSIDDLKAERTVKCVVHVVYNQEHEDIADDQIFSQIEVLNADFAATNTDVSEVPPPWQPLVGDSRIRFALAEQDPDGNPTKGITRTRTTKVSFGSDDVVKSSSQGGKDGWPSDRYLNIWVCPLGENLLGYAQFPGGPATTDGVVVLHSAFGTLGTAASPYDLGRTTTHEVGHWLG